MSRGSRTSNRAKPVAPPAEDVSQLAEHLFRQESVRLVSVLTSIFGPSRMQLAEDVAQEALVKALQTWPYYGLPANPAAWFTQVAKNLALDSVRREAVFQRKESAIATDIERRFQGSTATQLPVLSGEITDDVLRMIFVCCHPELPREGQTALALKTLCGFGAAEIARAFLTTEAAILKRLTRVRQRIRDLKIPFEIPSGTALDERVDGVLQTLYLLFNEGYKASTGSMLVRNELCMEAIRLGQILAEHPQARSPQLHALQALMLFNAARLPGRTDSAGHLLRLSDQDRSKWDRGLIARGLEQLHLSAQGNDLTPYHCEAAIACTHCAAASYEQTDWNAILWWYDHLVRLDSSPVCELNRVVAVSKVRGAAAGLAELDAIGNTSRLSSYYLYYALRGELELELNQIRPAMQDFEQALTLADTETEKRYLQLRLAECQNGHP